jgi:hypothetical protein
VVVTPVTVSLTLRQESVPIAGLNCGKVTVVVAAFVEGNEA